MHLSVISFIMLIIVTLIQFNFPYDILESTNALQTNNTNQLSDIVVGQPEQEEENEDDLASIFNEHEGTKANPGELNLKGTTLTPDLVVKELNNLSSEQIVEYPLQELSSDDLLTTFKLLSDETLEKVLTNIKPDNLKIIFDKILPFNYESILKRVNQQTQKYIQDNTNIKVELY